MSGMAILCAVLSLLSGLIGFKFASEADILHLPGYITSLSITYGITMICTVVAVRGKSRYTILAARNVVSLRMSTRAVLATGLAMAAACIATAVAWLGHGGEAALLMLFQSTMVGVQFLSFDASNITQLTDNKRFWLIQAVGAFVRCLVIAIGYLAIGPSFHILALSGLLAAFAIASCYRVGPDQLVRRHLSLRLAGRYIRHAVGLDPLLRSGRMVSEQLLISSSALIAQRTASPAIGEAALLAVPYLNAAIAAFHQAFNRFEVGILRGTLTRRTALLTMGGLFALALLAYPLLRWVPILGHILPHPVIGDGEALRITLALGAATLPLVMGYGMADMLPFPTLMRLMFAIIVAWVVLLVTILLLGQGVPHVFLAIMATPALSVGIGFLCSRAYRGAGPSRRVADGPPALEILSP